MNVLNSCPIPPTRRTTPIVPKSFGPDESQESYTPSHRDPWNLTVGGIYCALPVVGTFGHISLGANAQDSAVSDPAKIGVAGNLLGTLGLAANLAFGHSTALTVASLACLAISGVAGAVATSNL